MKEAELTMEEVFALVENLPEDFIVSIELEVDEGNDG